MAQAHRALAYLAPENLAFRTSATWVLGVAHQFMGDRARAASAFTEVITISRPRGYLRQHPGDECAG